MSIWKVHRVMILTAALFSGVFGLSMLQMNDPQAWQTGMGIFSICACVALIVYFRWFQRKTTAPKQSLTNEEP